MTARSGNPILNYFQYDIKYLFENYDGLKPIFKFAFDFCYRPERCNLISKYPEKNKSHDELQKEINAENTMLTETKGIGRSLELKVLKSLHYRMKTHRLIIGYAIIVTPFPFGFLMLKKISRMTCALCLIPGMAISLWGILYELFQLRPIEDILTKRHSKTLQGYIRYFEKDKFQT